MRSHLWGIGRGGRGALAIQARAAVVAAGVVLAGSDVRAQQAPQPETVESAREALDGQRKQLSDSERRAKSLTSDVADLDAESGRLSARLVETAGLIQRSEAQMTSIEGRLAELEAQEKVLAGSLSQRHGQIAGLLGALQRMGRNPPPVLITRREDALQMVRSAILLSSAFPQLKDQASSLAGRLEDLQRVMASIRSEGQRLEAETARLNEARTRLAGLMETKKMTLAERNAELAAVQKESSEITRSVSGLSDLIERLDKTVAGKTRLGTYDRELKAQQPKPVASAAPQAPSVLVVTPEGEPGSEGVPTPAKPAATEVAALAPGELKPQIVELAPQPVALNAGAPAPMQPQFPFVEMRGKLPLPAHGRRVLAYGERTQYGGQSKGMVVETRFSAQITAPCDGWVVYAGEFRSYGQLLIINAGDGYHVLLAGMSQIDVQPGQFVLAAEPVGTMSGREPSAPAQASAPVLYVEFRKDGRPIDPDPWWGSGQQKVQR